MDTACRSLVYYYCDADYTTWVVISYGNFAFLRTIDYTVYIYMFFVEMRDSEWVQHEELKIDDSDIQKPLNFLQEEIKLSEKGNADYEEKEQIQRSFDADLAEAGRLFSAVREIVWAELLSEKTFHIAKYSSIVDENGKIFILTQTATGGISFRNDADKLLLRLEHEWSTVKVYIKSGDNEELSFWSFQELEEYTWPVNGLSSKYSELLSQIKTTLQYLTESKNASVSQSWVGWSNIYEWYKILNTKDKNALFKDMERNPEKYFPFVVLSDGILWLDFTKTAPEVPDNNGIYIKNLVPFNYTAVQELKKYYSDTELYHLIRGKGSIKSMWGINEEGTLILPEEYKKGLIEQLWSENLETWNRSQIYFGTGPEDKAFFTGACYAVTMTNMLKKKTGVEVSPYYIDYYNYYDQLIEIANTWKATQLSDWSVLAKWWDNIRCFELIQKYGIAPKDIYNISQKHAIPYDAIVERDELLKSARDGGKSQSDVQNIAKQCLQKLNEVSWTPPVEFAYNWKTVTTKEYAKELQLENLWEEYVDIQCLPGKDYFEMHTEGNYKSLNIPPHMFRDLIEYSLTKGSPVLFSIDAYEPYMLRGDKQLTMMYIPDTYNQYMRSEEDAEAYRALDMQNNLTTANHAIVGEKIIEYKGKKFVLCKDSGGASNPVKQFPWWRLMDLEYYIKCPSYTIEKSVIVSFLEAQKNAGKKISMEQIETVQRVNYTPKD